MKNLIVIGHPDKQSFCYNGIFSTIKSEIEASGQEMEIIDLVADGLTNQEIELQLDNLNILGTGGIDIEQRAFDYDLEFSFLPSPENQTIPINVLYQNVVWPVRCNARFDSSADQYCRPDFSRIREIFSKLSTNAVRQTIEDEIMEEASQLLQEPSRRILREILN